MKVALVSLARRGGMVHFLAELTQGLVGLVDLAVIVSAHAELDYLPDGIDRLDVHTGRSPLGSVARALNPFTWLRLAANMRRLRADVVHIVGVHEWNPLIAVLCRLQRLPLIYTVHDPELHPGTPWRIRVGDRITRLLAHQLVALTRLGKRQLIDRDEPPGRIVVVPHPMYTIFRRWRPRRSRPEKIILYFGRLEAYKGLDVLVELFLGLRTRLPGWRLVVAGDGQLPRELERQAPTSVEVINRYVPDEEVARLMARCSIVALPYTSATQSGVVALAQAFERPVVASAVGGLRETILQGRTGILVPPGDRAAFGRALRALAATATRRSRMRREIHKVADARWGPRVVGGAHMAVYTKALGA